MDKVVFTGFFVLKYGMGLIREKVRVVFELCCLITLVISFLGMVGFSICFIFNFGIIVEFL